MATQDNIKIYFDPVGNTMNIWWGDPRDAYESEEVDAPNRNDVIIKDKNGRPISIEMIGVLPNELNMSDIFTRSIEKDLTPRVFEG